MDRSLSETLGGQREAPACVKAERERESEREGETKRAREKERERGGGGSWFDNLRDSTRE